MNKKHRVINYRLLVFEAVFAIFIFGGIVCLHDYMINGGNDKALSVSIFMISLGFLFGIFFLIMEPICYLFDDDKLSLIYVIGPRSSIKWSAVKGIHMDCGGRILIPWWEGYCIYFMQGRGRFFEKGVILKNRRTKKLLTKYCNRKIEEFTPKKEKKMPPVHSKKRKNGKRK